MPPASLEVLLRERDARAVLDLLPWIVPLPHPLFPQEQDLWSNHLSIREPQQWWKGHLGQSSDSCDKPCSTGSKENEVRLILTLNHPGEAGRGSQDVIVPNSAFRHWQGFRRKRIWSCLFDGWYTWNICSSLYLKMSPQLSRQLKWNAPRIAVLKPQCQSLPTKGHCNWCSWLDPLCGWAVYSAGTEWPAAEKEFHFPKPFQCRIAHHFPHRYLPLQFTPRRITVSLIFFAFTSIQLG